MRRLIDPDSTLDQIIVLGIWSVLICLVVWAFIQLLYDLSNIQKITAVMLGLTAVGIFYQSLLTMEMMRKKISKFPLELKHKGDSYSPKSGGEESFLESKFKIINTNKEIATTNIMANIMMRDKQTGDIVRDSTRDEGNIPRDSRKDFVLNFHGLEDNKEYEIVVTLKCDEDPEGKEFRQRIKTGPENP